MRCALTILSVLAFSQSACAKEAVSAETSRDAVIVSEFEESMELELRDYIAGYDSVLFQEKSNPETVLDVKAAEDIVSLMRIALNSKAGKNVSLQKIRETSSFHISGVYLSDASEGVQSEAHLEYQEKIIASCNRQIARIVRQVTGSGSL